MKYVFPFTGPQPELAEIGRKGAAMATMAGLGLPVPPGFTISARACRRFVRTGDFPAGMWDEVVEAVREIEAATGGIFGGSGERPLLLVARSGTIVPLASVLNIGVTPGSLDALRDWGGDLLAAMTRMRHQYGLGSVVRRVAVERYQAVLSELRTARGVTADDELPIEDLEHAAEAFARLTLDETQRPLPEDPFDQLREAIETVFASWDAAPARKFRLRRGLTDDTGTPVTVHAMMFGEACDDSGAGVAFSRDPQSGEHTASGWFQASGYTTGRTDQRLPLSDLADRHPDAHAELLAGLERLEQHRTDVCELDFVVEHGKLWVLREQPAHRSASAAIRHIISFHEEGAIDREDALLRIEPDTIGEFMHARLSEPDAAVPFAIGSSASPGAASGEIVFTPEAAMTAARHGKRVILVRHETTSEELSGLAAAEGMITSHGGRTSHAAVVARGMGKPAVIGVSAMTVDAEAEVLRVGDVELHTGDLITIDGSTGMVYIGALPISAPESDESLDTVLAWADEMRTLGVWANADTPESALLARSLGAEGIGLARTEYMFSGDRLDVVRTLLISDDETARAGAFERLEELQIGDFERLLEAMDGLPVIVRLLDPPLHEFLPDRRDLDATRHRYELEGKDTSHLDELGEAIAKYEESNPMLGLRGVRLAVVLPNVYRVQVLAALEAVRRRLDGGGDPRLSLMVPLVGTAEELHLVREMIQEEVHYAGRQLEVTIGTMIELPRAALTAGDIALESDFFSFGTNDLTQTTLGLSRDDAEEAFLRAYLERGLLRDNPFRTIDREGVGRLIEIAILEGLRTNPNLEVGVCGEHGADPASIEYFHEAGVDYVSCSPPRIPVAKIAAAQAAIRSRRALAATDAPGASAG
jgi:pyruvate,orthophosphate dikinase